MNSKKDSYMGLKPNRIETLSDGVFAIVMTLLVIELSVPMISKLRAEAELGELLLEMWPKFLAFALSFLILGILWFTHHAEFHFIARSNGTFVWINILFLMSVALVPFSTALVGEYHIYSQAAIIFAAANGLLCMIMLNIIWWYASKKQDLVDKELIINEIEPRVVKLFQIRLIVGAMSFILIIVISFFSPLISLVIYGVIVIYGIISLIIWGPREKPRVELKKRVNRINNWK